jgi:hypothetical protein
LNDALKVGGRRIITPGSLLDNLQEADVGFADNLKYIR